MTLLFIDHNCHKKTVHFNLHHTFNKVEFVNLLLNLLTQNNHNQSKKFKQIYMYDIVDKTNRIYFKKKLRSI